MGRAPAIPVNRREDYDVDDLIERWSRPMTYAALSKETGLPQGTLKLWINSHPRFEELSKGRKYLHIKRQEPGKRSGVDYQDCNSRFLQGQTYEAIGDHYGVTRQRIEQIISKHFPESIEYKKTLRADKVTKRQAARDARQVETQALRDKYTAALKLYEEGLTLSEIRPIYPELNFNTFSTLYVDKAREDDPNFPSERGRDGRPYNWQKRVITAYQLSGNSVARSAKILNIKYVTMLMRLKRLRERGLIV